jgi:hypothetical protein
VFSGSFITAVSWQHTILISTLRLRIDTSGCSMMQKCYVRCSTQLQSNKSHPFLDFYLYIGFFTSELSCPLDFGYWTSDRLPCSICPPTRRLAHMLWGGGSNNSMCFNSFLGRMTGNPLMTYISTLLVFTIPRHHGGSGVVSQNCCGRIDDVTVVGLITCSIGLYL